MSFRYKSALLSLASMLLVYGWYFTGLFVARAPDRMAHPAGLVGTIVLLSLIQIAGHIVIVIFARKESLRLDEREYAFELRATRSGYYALIVGVFALLPLLGVPKGGVQLANAMLLLVVIAECIRQASFLIQYHRVA